MTQKKYALILGGSSGLGLATAHVLADKGYHLYIVHRDRKSSLAAFEKEVACMESTGVTVTCYNRDALKSDTIMIVLNEISKNSVQVIVHSIAKGSLKPLTADKDGLSKTDLDITMHAMATSWWEWVKALLASEKLATPCRNIAFTSEGNNKVWRGYGAVAAAKASLEALMRQMAVELAPKGITTNCVQAGITETPSFHLIPDSDHLTAIALKRNPFKRLTTPKDVADVVGLLCTEEAGWINGSVLKVDGGESLQ